MRTRRTKSSKISTSFSEKTQMVKMMTKMTMKISCLASKG